VRTYHAWRGEAEAGEYKNVPGFCKAATLEDIGKNAYVLTPGRYVGAADAEDDGEPFEAKMQRLTSELYEQFGQADQLKARIKVHLESLDYGQ
jgi:type I restriction enzyme M protein